MWTLENKDTCIIYTLSRGCIGQTWKIRTSCYGWFQGVHNTQVPLYICYTGVCKVMEYTCVWNAYNYTAGMFDRCGEFAKLNIVGEQSLTFQP